MDIGRANSELLGSSFRISLIIEDLPTPKHPIFRSIPALAEPCRMTSVAVLATSLKLRKSISVSLSVHIPIDFAYDDYRLILMKQKKRANVLR